MPEKAGDDEPEEAAPAAQAAPALPASVTITPAGVSIIWSDGTQTLVTPPGSQIGPPAWPGG